MHQWSGVSRPKLVEQTACYYQDFERPRRSTTIEVFIGPRPQEDLAPTAIEKPWRLR